MKKLFGFVTALLLILTLAACGGSPAQAPSQGAAQGEGGNIPKEASLCGNDAEAESCNLLYSTPPYNSLEMGEWSEVEYSSLSEMLLAVNSSKADWLYVPYQTARYIQRQHPDMTLLVDGSLVYYYSMLTRDTDGKLCKEIDGAISEMKADGSLDALKEQYLYSGKGFETASMPHFEGAKTIKIGITGDFPPMDYIAAGGNPAGFNAALCAAIGKKLEINIQFVSITADTRLTAMANGTVDVLFWQQGFGGSAKTFDGVCATQSYFRDYGAALTTKHPWEDIMERYGLLIKGSNYQKVAGERSETIPTQGYLTMLDFEKEQRKSFCTEPPYPSLSFGKYNYQSYASLSELQLALNGGKIDWAYLPYDTAKYMQSENPDLTVAVDPSVVYSYAMATRGEDSVLAEKLTGAISALREDGTLSALEDQYIYSAQGLPKEAAAPAKIEGVPTIRIGLTGSLPPFDYVSADGVPAGFNVAFANALGERLGVNIELTTVEVDARMTALVSKKIDVVFWMMVDDSTEDADADGVCITQPYHKSYGAAVTKDYPYEDILNRFGLLKTGGA